MEELKRPNHNPEKKQVVVNIGKLSTRGGGGIGGVILLGGALATTAFASAFILGKKKLDGSRDKSRRNTHITPPLAAVNKKDERENEANEKEQFTFPDADKHSSETTNEIEFKNDSQSLVLHEKHMIEINGVAVCDSETSEQILCSITPKRLQKGAISNGGVFHLPAQEQKTLLTLEIESTTVHEVKIQPSREAAIDENGTTKECRDFDQVEAEGEGRDDREIELMGEIHEAKCEDTKESNGNYVPVIGLKFSEEGTFVLEHGKDGQESSLPVVGSPISEHKNVDDDEKQDFLSSDLTEIIHDGEAIQQDEDDKLEHIEEHLVQEREKCNEPYEEIAPQKGEEEKVDAQCKDNIEEKGYIDHSTPENRQIGDSGKEGVQILAMHLPEDEPISPEEMTVTEDDAVNEDIEMSFFQQKHTEDEVEDSSETIDTGIATAVDKEDIIDGTDGDEDLANEAEQNTEGTVDASMESNLGGGGIWPAEAIQEPSIETQQEKLVNREIEGKIQEDTTVKRGKYELHPNKIIADNTKIMNGRCNSAKTFIERHAVDLATLKGYSTNSGMHKALLLAIPVLSSVSCSWFYGLSFDKFCFVVLLTIVLSKSMVVQ